MLKYSYIALIFLNFANCEFVYPLNIQNGGELLNASSRCSTQWKLLTQDLTQEWVIRLFDASSKIPSGILMGNVEDLGNFDACLKVEHKAEDEVILGKYCALSMIMDLELLEQTKVPLKLSLCLPDACNPSDLKNVAGNTSIVQFDDSNCQTKNTGRYFDGYDIMFAVLVVIGFAVTVFSTSYDYYKQMKAKKPKLLLTAFSLISNSKKLFSVNVKSSQMECLNGLRILNMVWVIIGHRFALILYYPSPNKLMIKDWHEEVYTQYILGAPFAVDAFLFISGLVLSHSFVKKVTRVNIKMVLKMYFHRYLRLTPALLALYLFFISWFRHSGSGPLWYKMEEAAIKPCFEYGWSVFLYVQNYVYPDEFCLPHTWYLSVDMQLFILSPLILVPLVRDKYKKCAFVFLGAIVVASVSAVAAITYIYETRIFSENFFDYYYYSTHARLAPWLIGFLFGAFLAKNEGRPFKISRIANLTIWAVVLASFLTMIFTGTDIQNNYDRIQTTIYLTLSRPALAVMLCWVVFACSKGYGGIVNWFLSARIFQPIARLTYSMYLLHVPVLIYKVGMRRTPMYFSDFDMMYRAGGDIIFTAILAVIWALLFEYPVIIIEKVLFRVGGSNKQPSVQLSNNNISSITESGTYKTEL